MNKAYERILFRFIRAFLAGAISTMIVVLPFSGSSWGEIRIWLGSLVFAGLIGGITGLIMAADKYFRHK